MKTAMQLKAHIRNLSRKLNVESEIILRSFFFERFLERLSMSEYRDYFILKGGILITAIIGINARATMDMDITITETISSKANIVKMCSKIISIHLEEGVSFY